MVRKPQRKSPGFILTPAAPPELALKGIETVEADLTAWLSRQRNEHTKSAELRKKLAQAQFEVMRKSGVDVGALAREVRELRRQRPPKHPLPKLPGLQPEVPVGLAAAPGYFLVTPPYSYQLCHTQQIDIDPIGTLLAYANPETGTMGIDVDSSDESVQMNISNAQAGVGIHFKSETAGALALQATAYISEDWGWNVYYARANTRGWAGFLVQGFDGKTNSLVETLVNQQIILFDNGSNGVVLFGGGFGGYASPAPSPGNFTAFVLVKPNRRYVIWFWCGGDIHADGWSEAGFGSTAFCNIEVSVPYFLLQFQPETP